MNGLIRASLNNPHAVTVFCLSLVLVGSLSLTMIPVDILPVCKSPAVQVLTFSGGMPAEGVEKDIASRIERWTNQADGMSRQESRSIVGASIVRNYFQGGAAPSGALAQNMSLATGAMPSLPPVIMPFDTTSTVPIGLVALHSQAENESTRNDVGRYEVR